MIVKVENEDVNYEAFVLKQASVPSIILAGMGLAGESGEFVEMVKKEVFHDVTMDREKALKELGDVLWYLTLAAVVLDSSLDEVASRNVVKIRARYPNGPVPGGGIRTGEGAA